uniref:Uncharacterized protein n=1 Tax=Noctiluca scintillans TaxID=2966 RepID=A0A7S1AXP5_NOCSC
MRPSELRKVSAAMADMDNVDSSAWEALATRCETSAGELNHWDAISILQAFTRQRVENESLFLSVGDALCSKTSKLAPKNVLDLFAVFEANGLRPRALYVELFHSILRLSRSMYAEELSLTLQALARYGIGNPTVVVQLMRTMKSQLNDCRLRYLCGATGALGAMQACPEKLLAKFDVKARFEVDVAPVQELLDDLCAFPSMEFSWRPYEELCQTEFLRRTRSFVTAEDMDQLYDPFEALAFLQTQDMLSQEFVLSLVQWCLRGVHTPNVRTERRPTARQLVLLFDICYELGLDQEQALLDTISYYVESGGGRWPQQLAQPLKFSKRRRYISNADPLQVDRLALQGENVLTDILTDAEHPTDPLAALLEQPETRKPAGRENCNAFVTSRKGVRPRNRRTDKGLKKFLRKDWPRCPIWRTADFRSRPKYQPGVATSRYPWAGVPDTINGARYVLRK